MAHPVRAGCCSTASARGLEVATIVRAHGTAVRQQQALSREQRQALRAIAVCRTPALGGPLDVCSRCGFERPAYHSCRNRHCPKCQSLAQARWIEQRMARVLDVAYFHVVFTLPAALRPLALAHRRQVFALLLRAAAHTLLALGHDPKRLGAELGITAVLHTWTREIAFHPHVHCIVTAGGLTGDRRHWRPARQRHLFPVKVLGALFRGKVLAALQKSLERGELSSADLTTRRTIGALHQAPWVVYVKRPFGGAKRLFQYLGRYTHRVGLSNQRLVAVTSDAVTFRTKDGRTATLHPQEFLRRLLLHVLPAGFVKIRHSGLFAPRQVSTSLPIAQRLLADRPQTAEPTAPSPWATLLYRLTGFDVTRCPRCEQSTLDRRMLVPYAQRAPP
jgi:predicted Zn-ribbon and HTH transcriptional regulator